MQIGVYGEELKCWNSRKMLGGGFVSKPQTLPNGIAGNKMVVEKHLLAAIRSYEHRYG